MATRVYVVFTDGAEKALVRATSKARAVMFVASPHYEAVLADGDAMYKCAKLGMEIQDAEKPKE